MDDTKPDLTATVQPKEVAYKTSWGTFRLFGLLTEVENGPHHIYIYNDKHQSMCMSKRYHDWAGVLQRATMLVGKEILTETGSATDPKGHMLYFRDIAPENENPEFSGRVLERLPERGSFTTEADWQRISHEIILSRIQINRLKFTASHATEDVKQLTGREEQRTQEEITEATTANKKLEECWEEFSANPTRSLVLAGQNINKSKFLKKIDVAFAMRMQLDVTKRKRITIKIEEKIPHKNKVRCRLPEFSNVECIIAIKQSDHHDTKGEWSAATVENTLKGWWNVESEPEFLAIKSRRATSVEPFFEAFEKIRKRITGL